MAAGSAARRAELVAACDAHTRALAAAQEQTDRLTRARRLALLELHREHGMSFRELGALVGLSAASIQTNLRAVGLEPGSSTTKSGRKPAPATAPN